MPNFFLHSSHFLESYFPALRAAPAASVRITTALSETYIFSGCFHRFLFIFLSSDHFLFLSYGLPNIVITVRSGFLETMMVLPFICVNLSGTIPLCSRHFNRSLFIERGVGQKFPHYFGRSRCQPHADVSLSSHTSVKRRKFLTAAWSDIAMMMISPYFARWHQFLRFFANISSSISFAWENGDSLSLYVFSLFSLRFWDSRLQ